VSRTWDSPDAVRELSIDVAPRHDRSRYRQDMTTYSGPATLILADGARVAGMASLATNHRGDLRGWSGTFRPDEASKGTRDAGDELQLELPYEQIAAVAVTGVRKVLATQVLMSLVGRGPAPF
jgi:hypothetical protein